MLIADSVYDARSRTFLELVAKALGFEWVDVVRFENRVTDALEIQEAVEKTEQGEIIEGRRTQARRRRYAYMGLAAAGTSFIAPHRTTDTDDYRWWSGDRFVCWFACSRHRCRARSGICDCRYIWNDGFLGWCRRRSDDHHHRCSYRCQYRR